jgi:hypothetical protein
MNRIKFTTAVALILSLSSVFGASRQTWAQEERGTFVRTGKPGPFARDRERGCAP